MKVDFDDITKETYKIEDEYIKTLTQAYQDSLKDIDEQIRRMYAKYNVKGKFSLDAFQKMTKTEQGQITRLELLEKQVFSDLTRLAQGRPQQLAGYLTDVYGINFEGVMNRLLTEANITGSFDAINRQAVYESIMTPTTNIAIKDLSDTLKMDIRRDITNGIMQGDGIGAMMNRIRKSMNTNVNRAETIARTETTRVMGQSRNEGFNEAEKMGIKFKKVWISATDKRTRKSHARLNEESVRQDRPFSNGLMFPGEPGADPSEVINCRCTMIADVETE